MQHWPSILYVILRSWYVSVWVDKCEEGEWVSSWEEVSQDGRRMYSLIIPNICIRDEMGGKVRQQLSSVGSALPEQWDQEKYTIWWRNEDVMLGGGNGVGGCIGSDIES